MPRGYRFITPPGGVMSSVSAQGFDPFEFAITNTPKADEKTLKDVMKKRHLNKDERQVYHKPTPDWVLTPSGEVCKSACHLVVDDLIKSAV